MMDMSPGRGVLAPGSAEAVAERKKASVRKEAGHPFLVVSRQFGDMKARYRRLAKNGSHLVTLFALSNLSMAPRALGGAGLPYPRADGTGACLSRLVQQTLGGAQTCGTLHVGAADTGAHERIGQVCIREVGTTQVGTVEDDKGQVCTGQFRTGQIGT